MFFLKHLIDARAVEAQNYFVSNFYLGYAQLFQVLIDHAAIGAPGGGVNLYGCGIIHDCILTWSLFCSIVELGRGRVYYSWQAYYSGPHKLTGGSKTMLVKYNRARVAPVLAEFLGTGLLVMVTLVLSETTGVPYFIATSVTLTLVLVYVLFGSVSGAHVNPAITLGMWTARKISALRGVSYIAAQFLGAAASWQLYQYLTHHTLAVKTTAWSTPMFIGELVGTAILAMGLTGALTKGLDTLTTALAYGAAFFAGILVAATVSAGYLNPASALALRNFNAVYILGPLVGSIVGVNLYVWFFAPVKAGRAKAGRKK